MAEQRTFNPKRVGSSPTGPTNETLAHQGLRCLDSVVLHGTTPDRLHGGCSSAVLHESVGVDAYARGMIEWRSDSGMFNDPCGACGLLRFDHDDDVMGHGWHASASEGITEPEMQARIRAFERERRGEYDAPLPPPAERRHIRETAGWSQERVADELHLSRHTVMRFERLAGWRRGQRLPGREPSGDVRVAYSALLKRLLVGDG
jgi:hypothetical protein